MRKINIIALAIVLFASSLVTLGCSSGTNAEDAAAERKKQWDSMPEEGKQSVDR